MKAKRILLMLLWAAMIDTLSCSKIGATGLAGLQGEQGARGKVGSNGPHGDTGSKGATGARRQGKRLDVDNGTPTTDTYNTYQYQ